jgi:hypothetical protein
VDDPGKKHHAYLRGHVEDRADKELALTPPSQNSSEFRRDSTNAKM